MEAGERILAYITDMDEEAFLADTKTQDAVVRNFEIMGEAAKRLSSGTREAHPSVPWSDFARFRDVLIHQYDQIVPADVWRIAAVQLPPAMAPLRAAARLMG